MFPVVLLLLYANLIYTLVTHRDVLAATRREVRRNGPGPTRRACFLDDALRRFRPSACRRDSALVDLNSTLTAAGRRSPAAFTLTALGRLPKVLPVIG